MNCASFPELFEQFLATKGVTRCAAGGRWAGGGTLFSTKSARSNGCGCLRVRTGSRARGRRARKVDVRDRSDEQESGRSRRVVRRSLTSVFPIVLPPLRERPEDITELAGHFLHLAARRYGTRAPRLTLAAGRELEAYDWPGNVRELQHVIERAVLLSRGDTLRLDGILTRRVEPARTIPKANTREAPSDVIPDIEWRRRERANLRNALKLAEGRIYGANGAAELLGVKPTTLISRLKALGIARH
jgi:DNA-binding NtrC family response regulator